MRVPACAAYDASHRIGVNIADRQLVQVGGEATARLHFALGVNDQGLPGPFTIIFLKPAAVPRAGQPLRPLHRGEMIPVERHRELGSDKQIAPQQFRPLDYPSERCRQSADRLQALIGPPAGVGD